MPFFNISLRIKVKEVENGTFGADTPGPASPEPTPGPGKAWVVQAKPVPRDDEHTVEEEKEKSLCGANPVDMLR